MKYSDFTLANYPQVVFAAIKSIVQEFLNFICIPIVIVQDNFIPDRCSAALYRGRRSTNANPAINYSEYAMLTLLRFEKLS